jgi:hypothetical protein
VCPSLSPLIRRHHHEGTDAHARRRDRRAGFATKNSVTSKSIKNGTVKTKDLDADVSGSVDVVACNMTAAPLNPVDDSFGWVVFDN